MIRSIGWTADFGPIINASLCQMTWAWGLPLSFTLTLGIVTMRTWRLYRIFVHYLDPGKFLSNSALTLAVLLLASVDVAIAIIWTTVDPMKLVYKEITVKLVLNMKYSSNQSVSTILCGLCWCFCLS